MTIGIDASRANVAEKTGTEWYSFHVIRSMVLRHPEVRFRLYTKEPLRPPLDELCGKQVENRVLRWPPRFLWSQLRLSFEMLFHRPDVLFVPAHTIPFIHPYKTVTTCHDVGFERFPTLYGQRRIGGTNIFARILSFLVRVATLGRYGTNELDYHRISMRLAVRSAKTIITVSHFSAAEIQHFYHVPAAKLRVIPLGYDPAEAVVPVDATARRTRFGLTHPYIVYTGRLERKKNIAGLIQAYALLQGDAGTPDLVLVGTPGEGDEEINAALACVPVRHRIHVLPWLSPTDLSAVMAGAVLFVLVSFYEGFGLPLLNAFAHGVPVVAARAGSLPEVAGDAAVLVDPEIPQAIAEGCRSVLDDRHCRARLIERGYARIRQFRWETTAEETFRVLRQTFESVA